MDKADYLIRDSYHLKSSEIYPKDPNTNQKFELRATELLGIFYNARVSNDRQHIEYRYKDFKEIYHLFDARSKFHIFMYRHPKCLLIEKILAELIIERENCTNVSNTQILSEITSKNMDSFLQLTDDFIDKQIEKISSISKTKLDNVINDKFTESDESDPNSYKITIKVEYAGTKMKEENIYFYGHKNDKSKIDQQKGHYEDILYFSVNDKNNNDN